MPSRAEVSLSNPRPVKPTEPSASSTRWLANPVPRGVAVRLEEDSEPFALVIRNGHGEEDRQHGQRDYGERPEDPKGHSPRSGQRYPCDREHQRRGEVRFDRDETDREGEDEAGREHGLHARGPLGGDGSRCDDRRELRELGRLERDATQREPTARAELTLADREHDHQQRNAQEIERDSAIAQQVIVDPRQRQHGEPAEHDEDHLPHYRAVRCLA